MRDLNPPPLPNGLDLVSFDVFDTLVTRVHRDPLHVFEALAAKHPTVFGKGFATGRAQAERDARRACDGEEVTLGQVYERCVAMGLVPASLVAEAMACETEYEVSACVPRPEGQALFRRFAEAGMALAAISDMYLPGETVARILTRCGYPADLPLWVSADHDATKHAGTLFDVVRGRLGVVPGRWMHVGDNPHADVRMPASKGLQTLHLPLLDGNRRWERGPDVAGGLFARAATIVSAARPKLTAADRFWQDVGCSIAAPLVMGHCLEIRRRAEELGADAICFLARDGLVLKKAYEAMFPGDARHLVYLHASRRVANFASIDRLDGQAMEFLLGGKDRMTMGDLLARIGVDDVSVVSAAVAASGVGADHVNPPRHAAEAGLRAVAGHILAAAADERACYLGYLAQEGVASTRKVVVADVGWHCSIQKALAKILAMGGHKATLHGVYLGTKRAAYDGSAIDAVGWLYQADRPRRAREAIDRCTEFVELLFASPEHGVQRIVRQDGRYVPVRFERPEEDARMAVAGRLHEAVEDMCGIIRPELLQAVREDMAALCTDRVEAFLTSPDAEAVAHVSAIQHSLGFGSTTYRTFVSGVDGWSSPRAVVTAMLSSFWREGFAQTAPRRYRPVMRMAVRYGIPACRHAMKAVRFRHHCIWKIGRVRLRLSEAMGLGGQRSRVAE